MTKNCLIIGAVAGDIIGSSYEFHNTKRTEFELFTRDSYFTDDSVLTMATMDALLNNAPYAGTYRDYGRRFPRRSYGDRFEEWIKSENPAPYNSYGNGAAMRVSPIGWYCDSIKEVMQEAKKSAEVSHNHPEGIKGAQAVAASVFLARKGKTKEEIKEYITGTFGYNLDRTISQIRPFYQYDLSCQGTVPQALTAFLESSDYESAVRLAVSLGGDSDTVACITGGIAEAFYGEIPVEIVNIVRVIVGPDLIEDVVVPFSRKYGNI
jgi:ADP-ribosylglycohydrolase